MFYYTMNADLSKLLNNFTVGSVAGLFLVAFAVSASGAGMLPNPTDSSQAAPAAQAESNADYQGYVEVAHQRDVDGDGEYETLDTYKGHNMIMNQGLNFFECIASDVGCPSATTAGNAAPGDKAIHISLSNQDSINGEDDDAFDSSGSSGTDKRLESLPGEIQSGNLSRTNTSSFRSPTVADQAIGHYSTEFTFTATSDFTNDIEWTGLHWSGNEGDDDIVAGNHFPGVTMLADDKLTISWTEVSFSEQ